MDIKTDIDKKKIVKEALVVAHNVNIIVIYELGL